MSLTCCLCVSLYLAHFDQSRCTVPSETGHDGAVDTAENRHECMCARPVIRHDVGHARKAWRYLGSMKGLWWVDARRDHHDIVPKLPESLDQVSKPDLHACRHNTCAHLHGLPFGNGSLYERRLRGQTPGCTAHVQDIGFRNYKSIQHKPIEQDCQCTCLENCDRTTSALRPVGVLTNNCMQGH